MYHVGARHTNMHVKWQGEEYIKVLATEKLQEKKHESATNAAF